MPLQLVGPDSNGLRYQAVTPGEWAGELGASLRASGYRYCGFGTWGVYVAGPGEPCSMGGATQPPAPPPGPVPILPPPTTTGGSGSPPAPTAISAGGGCVTCAKPGATPASTGAPSAAPLAASTTATATAPPRFTVPTWPWWAWLLIGFALAQVVRERRA